MCCLNTHTHTHTHILQENIRFWKSQGQVLIMQKQRVLSELEGPYSDWGDLSCPCFGLVVSSSYLWFLISFLLLLLDWGFWVLFCFEVGFSASHELYIIFFLSISSFCPSGNIYQKLSVTLIDHWEQYITSRISSGLNLRKPWFLWWIHNILAAQMSL